MVRKFGTELSTNILDPHRLRSHKPLQKKVKVRRGNNSGDESIKVDATQVKSVTFLAGPVGIELEPANILECKAKVVRFVDGGPKDPGQARKCGDIKPGDLILKAQAANEIGTSYEGVIRVLKMSHSVREISYLSAWESANDQLKPVALETDSVPSSRLPETSQINQINGKESLRSPLKNCQTPGKIFDFPTHKVSPPNNELWSSTSRFDVSSPEPANDTVNRETNKSITRDGNQMRSTSTRSLSKVIGAMYSSIAPFFSDATPDEVENVSSQSVPVEGGADFCERGDLMYESKKDLLKELREAKAALDFRDAGNDDWREGLHRFFREKAALQRNFEEKLRIARSKHVS
jgi:hypothetical protein